GTGCTVCSQRAAGTEENRMVSACPTESDPRLNVEEFVGDRSIKSLAGLREEGLDVTVQVLLDELKRQRMDGKLIFIDRDFLCDNGIDFARELIPFLDKEVGGRDASVVFTDIPVKGWEDAAMLCYEKGADVFYCTLACRQTPLVTRIGQKD
ncbi:MAG: hypothetical protein J5674_02410, partial [Candidatus Methanomethylophilaceae archaeon]|nr:hypothetical protein [Candidatus Methanomethylophilaceae archaeon]